MILIDEHYYLDEQCSWISHLKLTSYCSGQTLYCIKLLLDCYRSRFDVLWNNWMTVALIYYLKWTVFASHHSYTEVTAHDWTLAGWCCVLSSQCMSVHPMIHQCHPDLLVKYLRKMHSSIILQRYGTNVILKKHHWTVIQSDDDYHISSWLWNKLHLYQRYVQVSLISTDVTNSDRYQQSSFQPTSTSTFLDATTSHQSSLIVLKFIVLPKVLL